MTGQTEPSQKINQAGAVWILVPLLLSGFVYLAMKLDPGSSNQSNLSHEKQGIATRQTKGRSSAVDQNEALYQTATSLQSQNSQQALEYFNRIPVGTARYQDALKHAAQIYYLSGQYQEAKSKLLKLNNQVSDDPLVQLSLAELFFKTGEFKQALLYARRSSKALPERIETHLLIAEIQDELDQPEKMIPELKHVLELDPQNQQAHLNLLYAYHYAGEYEFARKEAKWCLENEIKTIFVYQTLAKIEIDQGHFDQAAKLIQIAIAMDTTDMENRIIEADLLLFEKKAAEAYEKLKRIYPENQYNIRYIGALARVAARSGDVKTAKKLHQKLAEYHRQRKNK